MLRIGVKVFSKFAGEKGKGKGDWESVRQGRDDWTKSGVRESVRQGRNNRWGEAVRVVAWLGGNWERKEIVNL
jgi:hypothetical protein